MNGEKGEISEKHYESSSTTTPSISNQATLSSGAPSNAPAGVSHQQSDITSCTSSSEASETSLEVHSNPPTLVTKCVTSHTLTTANFNFIGDVEQLQCDSKGGKYEHSGHGISFYIPPGTVNECSNLTLTFGVTIFGAFKYPDNTIPVSPVLWVQVEFSGSQSNLENSIEIRIRHPVAGSCGIKYLRFLCSCNYKLSDTISTIVFERAHRKSTISPNEGVLHTKLSKKSYCFCISSKNCRELIANLQYCILRVTPEKPIASNRWKIHFFVTYAIPTCIAVSHQVSPAILSYTCITLCSCKFVTDGEESV